VSRRTLAIVLMTALTVTAAAAPAQASSHTGPLTGFALPAGFQPEGIAIGSAPYAYFGSVADGDIYRASLITGRGQVISQGPGTPSVGLKLGGDRLFVAGGSAGDARVVDVRTGRVLKSYTLQTVPSFINDVALTGRSAWYTDSTNPTLFQLALGRHGRLPSAAKAIPLTGDIAYVAGEFNVNGIAPTPDGRGLIIVQSNTGKLFHTTYQGVTTQIDIGAESVPNGDGLWLHGRTLYVVQNFQNVVAKIQLNGSGTRGELVSRTTDAGFDVPTTIAEYGNRLYLPNARFSTPPTPTTPYDAVSIKRP
jgi:hypothetical protein